MLTILISLVFSVICGCNPFSPEIEDQNYQELGDNTTIDGLMKNFAYSYSVKDSFLYATLLDSDFVFTWDNNGTIESWSRDEDIRITKRLFRSFKKINLVFNSDFPQTANSNDTALIASFNIAFITSGDQDNFTGHAKFHYRKKLYGKQEYKIYKWEDLK